MTDAPKLFDDSRDLLDALVEADADYLVVGAHALAAHGLPRATADFDVLVRPSAENARRVLAALVTFGAPVQQHGVGAEDLARPGTVYQLGLPPRRIDVLTSISGVDFDEAWASRIVVNVEGRPVSIIGRDALIKNKLTTGRAKDLLDVEALRRDR